MAAVCQDGFANCIWQDGCRSLWGKTFGGAVCRWHMIRTGWSGAQSRYTAALQHYKFDVPLLAAFFIPLCLRICCAVCMET